MRVVLPIFSCLSLFLAACGLVRDDAPSLLGRGRYVEAVDLLIAEEPFATDYAAPRRARYALYRGLAHLALGNAPATDRWLGEAKMLYDADCGCLSADDAGRLLAAWRALGRGL